MIGVYGQSGELPPTNTIRIPWASILQSLWYGLSDLRAHKPLRLVFLRLAQSLHLIDHHLLVPVDLIKKFMKHHLHVVYLLDELFCFVRADDTLIFEAAPCEEQETEGLEIRDML